MSKLPSRQYLIDRINRREERKAGKTGSKRSFNFSVFRTSRLPVFFVALGIIFFNVDNVGNVDNVDNSFEAPEFTFVRIKYNSNWGGGRYRGWYESWATDWPAADRNFTLKLKQVTSIKVADREKILTLNDPELFLYPFIYMLEVGSLGLSDEEASNLRRYLLQGGFLMIDDFHGGYEWDNFYEQIKKVFPNKEPTEIPINHPIFHCFFDFDSLPQIPGLGSVFRGVTYERYDGYPAHCRGLYDDKGRLMVVINYNTDIGDGWEHAADPRYPRKYSDLAYKLGINMVIYALTH